MIFQLVIKCVSWAVVGILVEVGAAVEAELLSVNFSLTNFHSQDKSG